MTKKSRPKGGLLMSVMMMAPVMVMMTPVMVMVAPHVMMTPCVVVAVMPHLH
jgi:hypothetical protein